MQQQRQLTETERLFVRRWLLRAQKQHGLYNVDNRHQCLRDSRRATCIVQPFQPHMAHFYGCTICGQYHICRLHAASCPVVVDPVAQRLTCLYSGQLLRQAEALVPNVYDEANDDAPLGQTQQSLRVVGAPRQCYSNMRAPRRPTKRPRLHVTGGPSFSPITSKNHQRPADERDMIATTVGQEASVEEEEAAVELMDEEQQYDGEGVVPEAGGGDDEGHSVTYHSNYNYWTRHFAYLLVDQKEQHHHHHSATMTTEDAIGDEPEQRHVDKESDAEYGMAVAASQATEGSEAAQVSEIAQATGGFNTGVVTPAIADDIEETVSSLVQSLLRLQLRQRQHVGATPPTTTTPLQVALVQHFSRLIRAIATLVYNSPVLRTIHQSRAQRHKPRGGEYAPHAVISPLELCLALLLSMLARGFYHEDSCAHVVELWSPHAWLGELLTQRDASDSVVTQLLAEKRAGARYKKLAALYEQAKIGRTVVRIGDCLSHYQDHAFWARNFILTHK